MQAKRMKPRTVFRRYRKHECLRERRHLCMPEIISRVFWAEGVSHALYAWESACIIRNGSNKCITRLTRHTEKLQLTYVTVCKSFHNSRTVTRISFFAFFHWFCSLVFLFDLKERLKWTVWKATWSAEMSNICESVITSQRITTN